MADSKDLVIYEEPEPYHDPRQEDEETRLKKAKEHEEKLQHIMDTVPIKISNVMGSSAGAGSGEFHIYLKARNAEKRRIEEIDREWRERQKKIIEQKDMAEKQAALDSKTDKRRAKRQRRKEKEKLEKEAKRGKGSDAASDSVTAASAAAPGGTGSAAGRHSAAAAVDAAAAQEDLD